VPVGRVADVTGQEDRIVVTLFDTANVPAVVKASTEARNNAYALNPKAVAVNVPPASGEKAEMARHVKELGEEAKVDVRAVCLDANKQSVTTSMSGGSSRPVVGVT
jgi:ribosome recycling factor